MQGKTWTEAQRQARLAKLVERNRSGHAGAHLYEDAEWMRAAYLDRGLTLREVAAEAGCGLRTVARWMAIHGIATRSDARARFATGPEHPNWTGGLPTCPTCGERLTHYKRAVHLACQDRSGERGSNWRGDNIEYTGAHERVVAQRGKPSEHLCAHCGRQAREWAYDHGDPNEKRNVRGRDEGPFSLDINHYMPMCAPCHRRFDFGLAKQRR